MRGVTARNRGWIPSSTRGGGGQRRNVSSGGGAGSQLAGPAGGEAHGRGSVATSSGKATRRGNQITSVVGIDHIPRRNRPPPAGRNRSPAARWPRSNVELSTGLGRAGFAALSSNVPVLVVLCPCRGGGGEWGRVYLPTRHAGSGVQQQVTRRPCHALAAYSVARQAAVAVCSTGSQEGGGAELAHNGRFSSSNDLKAFLLLRQSDAPAY